MVLKKKVAIIVSRLDQLGPVKVIQDLVNSLVVNDELEISVFYLDKLVDPQVKIKVPVELLDRSKFPFGNFDIVHTNGIRPDLFAFLNRKKIGYHISTVHNFVFEDLSYTYNKFISLIFGNIWLMLWRRADKLVCVSGEMKKYYSKWFPPSKLEIIYNGIAEPDNSIIPDNDVIQVINDFRLRGLKIIGSAGILTKRKGMDQLLYMIAATNESAFLIFGDGKELQVLKDLAIKLEIIDRCLFCGFRNDAVNYFKFLDIFITPSRSEGFGLVLIEAVQQKVPVICSDIAVFRELFNNEEVTFFKLEDMTSMAVALKVSVETGNIKADLAYTRYLNTYTDKLMAKRYLELYQSAS